MERCDNMQQKQEQEEHEQFLEAQTKLEMNAMSDAEFFQWIGSIEQEVKNVSL